MALRRLPMCADKLLGELQKSLDNNILSADVYSIKKSNMQKSYNMWMQRRLANDGNVL